MTTHESKEDAEMHVRVLQAYVRKLESIITEREEQDTWRRFDEDYTDFFALYDDAEAEVWA